MQNAIDVLWDERAQWYEREQALKEELARVRAEIRKHNKAITALQKLEGASTDGN